MDEFVILPQKVEEDLTLGRIADIILTETITFCVQLFNTENFSEPFTTVILCQRHNSSVHCH